MIYDNSLEEHAKEEYGEVKKLPLDTRWAVAHILLDPSRYFLSLDT
jgi:hypothetical protein